MISSNSDQLVLYLVRWCIFEYKKRAAAVCCLYDSLQMGDVQRMQQHVHNGKRAFS